MKTISEILKDKVSNGYVALRVEEDSSQHIKDVVGGYNVGGLINDMHMTLMFDESEPNIKLDGINILYVCEVVDIKTLGDPSSDWYALVLVIESYDIKCRFKQLQSLGYKHSYDDFVAHVSIKYKPTEEDISVVLNNKKEILSKLNHILLNNEYSESINKPDPEEA